MGTLKQASKILLLFEDAPTEQVQALLDRGLLADLRDGNVAEVKRDDFRKLLGLRSINPSILEPVGTVVIPATTELFVAREKFVVNTGANIRYIGNNFSTWFSAKVEVPMSGATLRYANLLKPSVDGPIMDELGDAKETKLAEIHVLMERQAKGKGSVLLTNGWANIFYVNDESGTLRAVGVYWRGDGWGVDVRQVASPFGWDGGHRVFSRNSFVTVAV